MKKQVSLLLLALLLLLPGYSHALDIPFFGGDKKDDAKAQEGAKKTKKKYLIHFKTGGSLETDNYTVTRDSVVVMMPAGAIYLDKKMVTSIEEVAGVEEETVQSIEIQPKSSEQEEAPAPPEQMPEPSEEPAQNGGGDDSAILDTDDNGHSEEWWNRRVDSWRTKKEDAEKRYTEAENDWNKYNGELESLDPDATPEYELNRMQDLRGSARVSMDKAQADIDEADRMLDEVLPDEARKAGAPPGWVR